MSVIDNKGRLFGKINLLDLVVVLAVLAVAGLLGYRHFAPKQSTTSGQAKTVEVVVRLSKIGQATVDGLKEGDEVVDSTTNTFLGHVIKKDVQPSLVPGATSEYPAKDTFDMYVTISGPGRVLADGTIALNGLPMLVGRAEALRTVGWASSGFIWARSAK